MIIVKTKNGDHFINDKAVTTVEHNKERATVGCYADKGIYSFMENVEQVVYTSDAQPVEWKDEGSEIQRLKAIIEEKEKELSQTYEHFAYIRDWFFIYQNALYDIKSAIFRSKNGSKCEDSVINAIIDEAEKKYEESEKRFKEARAKWDK